MPIKKIPGTPPAGSIAATTITTGVAATNLPGSLCPDSLTGAIAAIEGVRDAAVLLNGPTGCKFYHGALCEVQLPRADLIDPLYYSEMFYFGQPRVPATYLDDYDYVFGATEKLEKILPVVAEKGHQLIAVINTPGAALIGDDLLRFIDNADLPVPCIAMENTGFSLPVSVGFERAIMVLFNSLIIENKGDGDSSTRLRASIPDFLPDNFKTSTISTSDLCGKKEKPVCPINSVNLLGISIFHHHWEGNVAELTRLLEACGIRVNTVICAGCTLTELCDVSKANVNVVIHEEYARELVPFMKDAFHIESLVPPMGAPVGFTATEGWIEMVCAHLDVSPEPAMALIRDGRKKSYEALNRFNALTGLPKGASFAVDADASVVLPLTKWLYEYLGMIPVSVTVKEGIPESFSKVEDALEAMRCADAWQAPMDRGAPDMVFGSGADIAGMRLSDHPFTGMAIALPSGSYQHVIPKCYMGEKGALYIIERIINGLLGCSV